VKQLRRREVKQLLDEGRKFEFLDVRTPEERATAAIPGTRLLDQATAAEIEQLPKGHHAGLPLPPRRPQSSRQPSISAGRGFTNVPQHGGRHRRVVARGRRHVPALLSAAKRR
jgi:rhodanese-related sulfurtransferase